MTKADIASRQFRTASACSQSVAIAFSEEMGLEPALVHKLTTGFGWGMGGKQYTCGVITGGVFVISAIHGSSGPDEADKKAETKRKTEEFINAFEKRKGSSSCRDLLGMSLEEAGEQNLYSSICADCVRVAVEELEKVLKG